MQIDDRKIDEIAPIRGGVVTDSDLLGRVEALEAQVAELKSVQDLLMRLLSTTQAAGQPARVLRRDRRGGAGPVQLLDELLAASRGPKPRQPTLQLLPDAAGRDLPGAPGDRAFVQTLIDTLKVDRPAYRELHAYMAAHGWPMWD